MIPCSLNLEVVLKALLITVALLVSQSCLANDDCSQQAKIEAVNIAKDLLADDLTHERATGDDGFTITIGKLTVNSKKDLPKNVIASYWIPIEIKQAARSIVKLEQLLIFGQSCIRDQRAELELAAASAKRSK